MSLYVAFLSCQIMMIHMKCMTSVHIVVFAAVNCSLSFIKAKETLENSQLKHLRGHFVLNVGNRTFLAYFVEQSKNVYSLLETGKRICLCTCFNI